MPTRFEIYETYRRGPAAVLRLFEEALGTRTSTPSISEPDIGGCFLSRSERVKEKNNGDADE